MAQQGTVTKLYELRTLGYSQISKELDGIALKFEAIRKAKLDLNKQKDVATDPAEIQRINKALDDEKLKTLALRLERQQLTNEAKAQQNIRQAELNQQKAVIAGNQAEAGSIAQVRNDIRSLNAALIQKNQTGTGLINFKGDILSIDQAIAKLKQLTAQDQAYRRQFAGDKLLVGEYTSGIVQAFKQMGLGDLIGGQITKAQERLGALNASFETMKAEMNSARIAGVTDFGAIEAKMVENRAEAIALGKQVATLRTEFRGAGDIGNQISTSIANGFKNAKAQIGQFIIGYLGFQALISGSQKLIEENVALSDSFTQLRIYIHGTDDDVQHLFESLKKIDTRTSLSGLVDIATVVAKKGVARDQIAGITQELDKLFVLLGKEAGDPHEATASIVKLITIFNDDKHVTADRVNEIGTSIFKLTSSGVATGHFLIDFAERVGAVRGITGLTLPNILGMGAALEQLGQRTEVAGTAAVQLATKMFSNVPKFAEAAGKSVEEFRKLLKNNPFEALVSVAQNLKGGGKPFEEVITAFGEVGITGARIKAVLADIATNGEFVKQKMAAAGVTTADFGNIAAAASAKQNNFAATVARVRKEFEILGTNRNVQLILAGIASAFAFILANILPVLAALTLYGIGWLVVSKEIIVAGVATQVTNGQLVLQRLLLIGSNIALAATRIYLGAATIAQTAYNLAIALFTRNAALATTATRTLGTALRTNPIGIFLTLLGLVVGAMSAFATVTTKGSAALREQAAKLQAVNEINKKANEQIAEQIATMDSWRKVVVDTNLSIDTRKLALQKLIDQHPEFSAAINGEVIDLTKLKAAYDDVTKSIQLKAQADAAQSLSAEKQKSVLEVATLRQHIETEIGRGTKNIRDLTDSEKSLFFGLPDNALQPTLSGDVEIDGTKYRSKDIINALKAREAEATGVYQAYIGVQSKIQQDLSNYEKSHQKAIVDNQRQAAATDKLSVKELRDLIDGIDNEYDTLKEGDPKLQQLEKLRDAYQVRLDKLNDKAIKTKKPTASKLTATEKDAFKDIDATKDEGLALEKQKRLLNQEDEETYLKNVLTINRTAIDAKLKLLKGANAEERKVIAELNLTRITEEQDTNSKIFALREKALKTELEQEIADAQLRAKKIEDDPQASASAKAQAKLDADNKILSLQLKFNSDIDLVERQLGQHSLTNAKETAAQVLKVKEEIIKDQLALDLAGLKNAQAAGEQSLAQFRAIIEAQRLAIINSDKSPSKKDKGLVELQNQESLGVLAREVAALHIQLPIYKKLLEEKKITDTQYSNFVADLEKKEQQLQDALTKGTEDGVKTITGLKDFVQTNLADLFNFKKGSEEEKLLAEVISQTFALAQQAMNQFFDAKKARIEQDRDLTLKRLDDELQQRKDRAQSQAEQLSLDKEYQAKKDKVNREAFEKEKKMQKAQALISLATELGNIAVIAFSPGPANIATLGTAGIIMYAIMSALAVARYALAVGKINSAQYEYGGQPGAVPTKGGEFRGKPHSEGGTPFAFKGNQYEAEVNELSVIRTRNAPRNKVFSVTGNQSQIASAANVIGGGINFKPGAKIKQFAYGGTLGDNVQPPVYVPSVTQSVVAAGNQDLIDEVKAMRADMNANTDEQSKRIDRIKTFVVTNEITDAQKKRSKQNSIGTL